MKNVLKNNVCGVILVILFPVFSFSQNIVTDSSATVVGYWQKGEVAHFILTQKKERYENKKLVVKGSSSSDVEIKVLLANKNSYILNWKYTEIRIDDAGSMSEGEKEFASLTKGINFMYQASEYGEFQELINWAEVQAAAFKIIDRLHEQSKDPNLQTALLQARQVFSSKERIENLIMKDVQLYHTIYGGEYLLNQKMRGETHLPNTQGGDPFPALVEVDLFELNPKENTCKVRVEQYIDKKKMAEELGSRSSRNDQAKTKSTRQVDIIESTEYQVELNHGWVTAYTYNRTTDINGVRNIEKQELRRIN